MIKDSTHAIITDWQEKADENIYAGITLINDSLLEPGGILIWLGIEQLAKMAIIVRGILNKKYMIKDNGKILSQLDAISKSITKGGHGHKFITEGMGDIIMLTEDEIKCIEVTHDLFERRYLKDEMFVYSLRWLVVTKNIRNKLRLYLSGKSINIESRYDVQINEWRG